MRRRRASLWWSVAVLLVGSAAHATEMSYSEVDMSTVRVFGLAGVDKVDVEDSKTHKNYTLAVPMAGHGSGLLVSDDGLVLTARHVVEGARQIVVRAPGSTEAFPARVVYMDDREDFAFISFGATKATFKALPTAAPALHVRQTVFAVGYPFDASKKRPLSSRGVISGQEDHEYNLGISVNPGNSGGPLVDEQENVLGVVVARGDPMKGAQGIGYAVSLDRILKVLPDVRERHRRTRDVLGNLAPAELSFARVIARLVEGAGVRSMLDDARRALAHLKQSNLSSEIATAIALASADPDLLSVGCAYYWNASVMARVVEEDNGWQGPYKQATSACGRAVKNDRDVLRRSPFVKFVLDSGYGVPLDSGSSSTPKAPETAMPAGVAGFSFRDSVADVQRICKGGTLKLTGVKTEGLRCSGAPTSVGYETPVRLKFCEDQVCRVDLLTKLEGDEPSAWIGAYQARKAELVASFGPPTTSTQKLWSDCTESLSWCLANRKATLEAEWTWLTQPSVSVRLERSEGRGVVRVVYQRR